MTDKRFYQPPLIEVFTLSRKDIICGSGENKNNDLEWDWDSEWGSLYNKIFSNTLD